jgi:pilus assembly protein CpaC
MWSFTAACAATIAVLMPANASAGYARHRAKRAVIAAADTVPSTPASGVTTVDAAVSPTSMVAATASNALGFSTAAFSDKPMHLLVGHSAYITSAKRLSRMYVTNPGVLYAYTATPNQVLVTAKDPGVSSLMVWDDAGEASTYLFSADVDLTSLQATLKAALPQEDVHVQAEGGRVLMAVTVSTKDNYQLAEKLAGQYSKDVSNALIVNSANVKQVRLKVRMVEVDRTKLEQLGFNLFSTGGNTLAQSSTTQFPSTLTSSSGGSSSSTGGTTSTVGSKAVSVTNPLNFLLYSADLNVGAMIQDMESRQVLQILAEPNITTLSGEKANFLAGGEFPFPVVQGGAGGLTSISVQFRPYGVKLEFLPEVNNDGTIRLKVSPEVSALDYTNAVQISGYNIPAVSSRRADTQVVLQDGQTFAISGLLDQRSTDQFSRTPGIASIPILGKFFKSKNVNHSTTELLVLVTPELVDIKRGVQVPRDPNMAVPMLDRTGFDAKLPYADKKK